MEAGTSGVLSICDSGRRVPAEYGLNPAHSLAYDGQTKGYQSTLERRGEGDVPGGKVVKNLPSNAGNACLIPGWQLSPNAVTMEPLGFQDCMPQGKIPYVATKT